ncbi:hypothetical protein AAG570_008421 [Ranatra chinensis]|uniref:CCHC-type domain-containing protein n=1 Tax=Ranatra chinensis TaxID=642074 RepID=A0ABD0Z1M6_9HEMI
MRVWNRVACEEKLREELSGSGKQRERQEISLVCSNKESNMADATSRLDSVQRSATIDIPTRYPCIENGRKSCKNAGAHLRAVNTLLPPEVINNLHGILIRKISHQVRAECGITGSTEAAEVARLPSERYGGARRPPARSAIKLLRMRRAHGETPSAYMHRVDQAFRLVKARMAAVETAGVATAKLAVIEEFLREAVLAEMPEKTRRQLKTLTDANFGVLLAQVDEEEDDYQAAREDATTWTRVERRSERRPDRGHERRAPPNPPPQVRREQPARFRPAEDQRRGERRERLRCWECGSTRHLARSCPQIYRRDQQEAGRRPRPEPMEVNAVRGPRRGPREGNTSHASAASTGSCSSTYDYSSDEDWPALPQRTQRQGRKADRRISGATSGSPPDPGAKGQPKGSPSQGQ